MTRALVALNCCARCDQIVDADHIRPCLACGEWVGEMCCLSDRATPLICTVCYEAAHVPGCDASHICRNQPVMPSTCTDECGKGCCT